MRFVRIVIVPLLVIGVALLVAKLMLHFQPEPEKKEPVPYRPAVEVITVESEDIVLWVESQGTVQARTETMLTAEVSGKILGVSENFRAGGFFAEDEVLLQIEDADYQAVYALREASLSESRLELLEEQALAEQAKQDWNALGQGEATDLGLRLPHVARAEAVVRSAEAALLQAERDLLRTQVTAPYAGMVLETFVDVGQSVSGQPGTQLAKIFSVDVAEIRLPISIEDSAFLNLPYNFHDEALDDGPLVILSSRYGGEVYQWQGRIQRTEAAIDARSRLMYLVAEVDKPYSRVVGAPTKPPLMVGMFVKARIRGKTILSAFSIPRTALINRDTLLVVDSEDRLYRRNVSVVQTDGIRAVIDDGLTAGERVVVSPLEYVVDGMQVKVEEAGAKAAIKDD